ncbi:MAG: L-histidine N(alpha)-methyltransferase [Leptospiraceae bacterium]|nr:L-histidine N(alpha)-methyltransferase [Leptospiraceae bacterium]
MENTLTINHSFWMDVIDGLQSKPKKLPSKYFYNKKGDFLFQKIMEQPEYYLTRSEMEILQNHSDEIISNINTKKGIRLVEPGAGDGKKTFHLAKSILKKIQNSLFSPIDISENIINVLKSNFNNWIPELKIDPIICDYYHINDHLPHDEKTNLMIFLGSNLGNYNEYESIEIIEKFTECLNPGDYFLLGVDLVKNPNLIYSAYNDKNGYTSEFNLNLLDRINSELNANFDIEKFFHYPIYNPLKQQAESYLVSKEDQYINIINCDKTFHISKWEPIHTEISKKFTPDDIDHLAKNSKMKIVNNYFDSKDYFVCSLWKK